jgi:CRP-like cAMP-binding protein
MDVRVHFRGNHLLDALPTADKRRIYPQLEAIHLPLGLVLYDGGLRQRYAYFSAAAVISLQYLLTNGNSVETAAVGREGVVGTSIFMGADSTPGRAIVTRAGLSFRIKSQVIKEEFYRGGPLMQTLLRYTQALITQTSQIAVCNRHHSIDQQVCRRLLVGLAHAHRGELLMTHELMSSILGIRREGVSESARRLQNEGLIRYARGHIAVLDRRGLEHRTCECYFVMNREYERLLSREVAAAGTPFSRPTLDAPEATITAAIESRANAVCP